MFFQNDRREFAFKKNAFPGKLFSELLYMAVVGKKVHEVSCAVFEWRHNMKTETQDGYTRETIEKWLNANCKKWVYQGEKADDGYEHWCGRFSLTKKRQITILKSVMKKTGFFPMWITETIEKEYKKEAFYCMKEDTRTEGPYKDSHTTEEEEIFIPDYLKEFIPILYPWQQTILNSEFQKYTRKVNYIYDTRGNRGKSVTASIGHLTRNHINLPPMNDFEKIMATLCNKCMDRRIRNPKVVYIDMPRAMDKSKLYGMFSAIEMIKTGMLYDPRHHYKEWWVNPPAIWCFANKLPDLEYLSVDRWDFWTIDHETQQLCTLDLVSGAAIQVGPDFIDYSY